MRHPPRAVSLSAGAALAPAGTVLAPADPASAAPTATSFRTPIRTVEHSAVGRWAGGFRGSVTITGNGPAPYGRSSGSVFPGGRWAARGRDVRWSPCGAPVTAADGSGHAVLGTGAGVTAGSIAPYSGSRPAPTAFTPNGTVRGAEPGGATDPSRPPATGGEPPVPSMRGDEPFDQNGATRRLLGANRSAGESP